jgi:hypothetical protein
VTAELAQTVAKARGDPLKEQEAESQLETAGFKTPINGAPNTSLADVRMVGKSKAGDPEYAAVMRCVELGEDAPARDSAVDLFKVDWEK